MKIKVSEATPIQLNWMVAKAEGLSWWTRKSARWDQNDGYTDWILGSDGVFKKFWFDETASRAGHWREHDRFEPSTDWSQGGPIIEREEIGIRRNAPCSKGCEWQGSPSITAKGAGGKWGYGPTPLVAAMRCFVASRLGDEVDVPEELLA
jgi:hypothetical protein